MARGRPASSFPARRGAREMGEGAGRAGAVGGRARGAIKRKKKFGRARGSIKRALCLFCVFCVFCRAGAAARRGGAAGRTVLYILFLCWRPARPARASRSSPNHHGRARRARAPPPHVPRISIVSRAPRRPTPLARAPRTVQYSPALRAALPTPRHTLYSPCTVHCAHHGPAAPPPACIPVLRAWRPPNPPTPVSVCVFFFFFPVCLRFRLCLRVLRLCAFLCARKRQIILFLLRRPRPHTHVLSTLCGGSAGVTACRRRGE